MTEHLWTIPEVAAFLSLSPCTIWRKVLDGSLPSHKIGRSRRVAESDIRRWLEDTRQEDGRPVARRGRKG